MIKDSPGRYDLFVGGLVEGREVRFSIAHRDGGVATSLVVSVVGVRLEDRRLDTWFVDVLNRKTILTLYYRVRHKRGHVRPSEETPRYEGLEVK